jgi:hypothetical protein
MRKSGKLLLVAITAALVLASLAAAANANRSIEVRPLPITATSVGGIVFLEAGGGTVSCPLTLNVTLHSSISKAVESLMGSVGGGTVGRCTSSTGANVVARLLLLWHIRFQSFRGTLPNITGLLFTAVNSAFLFAFEAGGARVATCLYVGNVGVEGTGAAANEITRLRILETENAATLIRTRLQEEAVATCAREGTLSGEFTTTRITLRLI